MSNKSTGLKINYLKFNLISLWMHTGPQTFLHLIKILFIIFGAVRQIVSQRLELRNVDGVEVLNSPTVGHFITLATVG